MIIPNIWKNQKNPNHQSGHVSYVYHYVPMIRQVLPSPQHHVKASPLVCRSAKTLEVLGGFVTHNLRTNMWINVDGDTRRKDTRSLGGIICKKKNVAAFKDGSRVEWR